MSKQKNTSQQWWDIVNQAKKLFIEKQKDYGTLPWRILRLPSMVDQIFIKCKRIIEIQEKGKQLVDDPVAGEFIAMINYSIMGLINVHDPSKSELSSDESENQYAITAATVHDLLMKKNHDYGEAWRDFEETTCPDLIMQKIIRMKSMINNGGPKVSEGFEGNYMDIINYSVFHLILESEKTQSPKNK